jgi:DNA-directed RNA polymerase subunit RPC12/RpoP
MIQVEGAREVQRRTAHVREIATRHEELRPIIQREIGAGFMQANVCVGDHHYQLICEWERCIVQAKNLEAARRYEDAAKVYETLGLWAEAGAVRDKKTSRTVKHVTVNLNDLIDKLKSGGLSIPYKCGSCGASIVIDSNSRADGLKFCSYCGSAMDTDSITNMIRDALK